VPFRNSLHTQCGVQEYLAPETLEHSPAYDVPCDMWSVGVVIFLMIGGYYPFRGDTEEKTLKNSRYGLFSFKNKYWGEISEDVKNLIKRMLTVDPDERITAEEALSSSWMETEDSGLSADLTLNMRELRTSINVALLQENTNKSPEGKHKRRSTGPKFRISYSGT
jgi:calcium-dependent protein kinase